MALHLVVSVETAGSENAGQCVAQQHVLGWWTCLLEVCPLLVATISQP